MKIAIIEICKTHDNYQLQRIIKCCENIQDALGSLTDWCDFSKKCTSSNGDTCNIELKIIEVKDET